MQKFVEGICIYVGIELNWMKTNPSSSKAIEVERINMRDGFNYFPIAND
jgi:hypothetical protein